jgi:hypothetical protein
MVYDYSVQTAQVCTFQHSHYHTGGFCHFWLQWVTQQLHMKSPHHNRAKKIPSQTALQEPTAQPLPYMLSQWSFTFNMLVMCQLGFNCQRVWGGILFICAFRTATMTIQPSTTDEQEYLLLVQGDADHLPQSSAKFRNTWNLPNTSHQCYQGMMLDTSIFTQPMKKSPSLQTQKFSTVLTRAHNYINPWTSWISSVLSYYFSKIQFNNINTAILLPN